MIQWIMFFAISASILVIVVFNLRIGPDRIYLQIIRVALMIIFCCAVYSGYYWARNLLVILFGIAALSFGLRLLNSFGSPDIMVISLLLILLIGYGVSSVCLLISKDIESYMDYVRNLRDCTYLNEPLPSIADVTQYRAQPALSATELCPWCEAEIAVGDNEICPACHRPI